MSSSIYTRTGDKGQTSLADGSRVDKIAIRVEAYGTVDEANSWVGAARAFNDDPLLDQVLEFMQHRLYNCSSNIATPPSGDLTPVTVSDDDVAFLELAVDRFEERSGPISGFVLPGGGHAAGLLHVARAVCRRAERTLWTLAQSEAVDASVLQLVNRASDLLFAAARYANAVAAGGDVMWDKDLPIPKI